MVRAYSLSYELSEGFRENENVVIINESTAYNGDYRYSSFMFRKSPFLKWHEINQLLNVPLTFTAASECVSLFRVIFLKDQILNPRDETEITLKTYCNISRAVGETAERASVF